jgi:hypothetical protein
MNITVPGIHEVPQEAYFADPCPVPSLSHSIAKKLLHQSPKHAFAAHPRLDGGLDDTPSSAMDDGSIVHAMLLGKGSDIAPIDADDFRTKAAKEARDAARAAGQIPVLSHKLASLKMCAAAAKDQIMAHPDLRGFFEPGRSEAVLAWQEGDTWCRGMIDRLPDDQRLPVFDLKLTGLSAAPEEWGRRMVREYATQDAFYMRGLNAIGQKRPAFLFIVVEFDAPYGLSVMASAPSLRAYADTEIERALAVWGECMKSKRWPGYPQFTAHVELPGWMAMRQEERILRDEVMAEQYDPTNPFNQEFAA